MSERFIYTEPMLCTYNYDLSKDWFVYFNFTDTLTGHVKRKQFRGGINTVKKKEERLLQGNALRAYWKTELKAGWNPFEPNEDLPMTRPLIGEALTFTLSLKAKSCSAKSMQNYNHKINQFIAWLDKNRLKHIHMDKFDVYMAQAYMDYLIDKKNYTGRYFNDHLVTLSTFFNCAVGRDWILKNPFRNVKKLPIEIGRNIAFTEKERTRLADHLQTNDINMYYFTQFIYYCFIRRAELTRLTVSCIDFKTQTIVIPAAASKNKRQESVVIPASFVPILKNMGLEDLPPEWFIFGRLLKPGPVQFINYNHISTRHNTICRDLKITKEKGLYSWKHSGVCELYKVLSGDIYSLMRQLRHSELTTTQIYLKSLGLIDNSAVRSAVW